MSVWSIHLTEGDLTPMVSCSCHSKILKALRYNWPFAFPLRIIQATSCLNSVHFLWLSVTHHCCLTAHRSDQHCCRSYMLLQHTDTTESSLVFLIRIRRRTLGKYSCFLFKIIIWRLIYHSWSRVVISLAQHKDGRQRETDFPRCFTISLIKTVDWNAVILAFVMWVQQDPAFTKYYTELDSVKLSHWVLCVGSGLLFCFFFYQIYTVISWHEPLAVYNDQQQ